MTDDEVWGAVVKWLKGLTTATVIKADQSAREPNSPHIIVRLVSTDQVREHPEDVDYEDVSLNVVASPRVETEWRFSVHAYSNEATQLLRPIRSAAHLAQMNEPLMPDLVVHDVSQIRNLPEYVNEKWQPRAQMDLIVRGIVTDGHAVDAIEQASFGIDTN